MVILLQRVILLERTIANTTGQTEHEIKKMDTTFVD
jgi:hypothetical protein